MDDLLGMLPTDLAAWLHARGVSRSDAVARQVLAHVVSRRGASLDLPRPIAKATRALLERELSWARPTTVERVEDAVDRGTVKYLFEAADGALFEAVRIPIHKPGSYTVCLSSQVGCAMGCTFCATGRLGLSRNLTAGEIVGSFLAVVDEAPGRVTGAVFMGQGEPLHNYDAVIQAARVLSDPCGGRIAQESITISTVGLVPALRRFTEERHPYRLVVSLHAATDALRHAIVPTRTRLQDLADAIRQHHAAWGGRVTVAWVVLGGVNTDPAEAEALRELLGDVPLRVNLIDVNDARPDGFRRATDDERNGFIDALQAMKVPVVRRYSVGRSSNAACGMLASTTGDGTVVG